MDVVFITQISFQVIYFSYLLQFMEIPLQAIFIVRQRHLIVSKHESFGKTMFIKTSVEIYYFNIEQSLRTNIT